MIQRKLDELGQRLDLSGDGCDMIDSILHAKVKDAQRQNILLEVTKKSTSRSSLTIWMWPY